MLSLAQRYLSVCPSSGKLGVFFLGQAGFAFKTPDGHAFLLDPYLSDCCERHFGFKRLMPYLCGPTELPADALLISHSHLDHCDTDSLPFLVENCRYVIAARDVEAPYRELKLPEKKLTLLGENETADAGWIKVTGMPCDHGELAPDALGLLIETEGRRLYFTGDTCYHPEYLEDPRLKDLDLLILPINGAFDNLDSLQGAQVCARLQPKLSFPCHFWNFAQHGGNPMTFMEHMARLAPEVKYELLRPGEYMEF